MRQNLPKGFNLYLTFAALFIAALVSCNLIFQKFFFWAPFGENLVFEISVGILPYPLTFLFTDIISEIFGRRAANRVVLAGLLASLFTLLIVGLALTVPATSWSPINDETFSKVFGLQGAAVAASMLAYMGAQLVDIRIFHFWKKKTQGKHLWIRNNASTMLSQMLDTATVLLVLCWAGAIEWERFGALFVNGYLFKAMFAAIDTPILYLLVKKMRKHYGLKPNEDLGF